MDKNAHRQAAHFDEHTPISPWPEVLRGAGFRYHYTAKDLMIKKALDQAAIGHGMSVLDIGCGTGVLLDRLGTTYGTKGIGIDISRKSLDAANAQKVKNSSFVLAEARALPFADGAFDLVVSLDVIEHVGDPEKMLREMTRVAELDGRMLIYAVSKRNKFTYQWFERRFVSLFGIDMHQFSCHDPDLLVDPELIRDRLGADGTSQVEIQFFHAFFSSLFDRFLHVFYLVLKKAGQLSVTNPSQQWLGVVVLSIASLMSRTALDALLWIDKPWFKRGYANGFLAVARRKQA